jgi:integrase/recombinase XerD
MRQALDVAAGFLSGATQDAISLPWHLLQYQHTTALRSKLMESYAPATCNKILAAVRRVLKECERLGQMSGADCSRACDIPRVKGSRLLKGRALSGAEINAIAQVCQTDTSVRGIRDMALLVILRVGLRRGEVINLDIEHLAPDGSLQVRNGKGDKDRELFLPQTGLHHVMEWVKVRGSLEGALLLPVSKAGNITRRRLSPQAVATIIQCRGMDAGLENFTPHDFRRTFISELFDKEVDVSTIQKLVGHSDPATTTRYDRRGDEAKRKAIDKLLFSE